MSSEQEAGARPVVAPFEALTADEAYADAPELGWEIEVVAGLDRRLAARFGAGAVFERREVLLRAAAVADRRAFREGTDVANSLAVQGACVFWKHDWGQEVEGGSPQCAGPVGVRSPRWDAPGGMRAYVRQEYAAWFAGRVR